MVALESKAGTLMKIAGNTSVDHFKDALNVRDVSTTCGHLVSLLVSSKGIENMPLALLSGYMKTALIQMHAEDELSETPGLYFSHLGLSLRNLSTESPQLQRQARNKKFRS